MRAKIENWGFEQWIRFVFAIGTLIISVIDVVWGSKATGVMGCILAIDQIQSMFTQRSMFSVIFSELAVSIYGSGKDWTSEQRQENKERFNVWTPFTFTQDTTSQVLNSLWSTMFTLVLIYGVAAGIGKLGGKILSKFGSGSKNLLKGAKSVAAKSGSGSKVFDEFTNGIIDKALEVAATMDDITRFDFLNSVIDGINAIKSSKFFQNFHYFYKAVYGIKQFAGGFISPTEWIELGVSGIGMAFFGKGIWGGPSIESWPNIANQIMQFGWNWGDNFYFIFLKDETTMGLYKWMQSGVEATIFDTTANF